ncbi:hypothetical protein D4T53_00070 [Enterococcus faecium]|nr:hypothetical protein [Enterococcus faecium]EGP5363758.1 hypothetical protein [Enterococcus faecium]EME7132021.1 hypothetical protein [Enterococcus faecium]NTJ69952.1 hypothetical protein [Enterococcus faecium]
MKKIIFRGVIVIIALSIGGKILMDRREKDNEELRTIQTDLANYLYNHYEISTVDEKLEKEIFKEFNQGKGDMTEQEFFERLDSITEYMDIEKIEFTGFSVTPMKSLEVHFEINDLLSHTATLGVKSAETGQWIYRIDSGIEKPGQDHYLSRKDQETNRSIPMNIVTFYDGGID